MEIGSIQKRKDGSTKTFLSQNAMDKKNRHATGLIPIASRTALRQREKEGWKNRNHKGGKSIDLVHQAIFGLETPKKDHT